MRERLAYLHFPKAAGTSVRAALSQYYDDDDTCPWVLDPYVFAPFGDLDRIDYPIFLGDTQELRRYRYLEGHWSLPVVASGFDPSEIACVLRDPRARLLSHYCYWRSWPDAYHTAWGHYDVSTLARRPLSEFLTHPVAMPQADNMMTRLTLGRHRLVPVDGPIATGDIDAVAAEACTRLDELGFVGVLESGAAMWDAFEHWFGSELPRTTQNTTPLDEGERIDLDDLVDRRTMGLLQDRSAADLQLWHHVADRTAPRSVRIRSLADASWGTTLARIAVAHARVQPADHSAASSPPEMPSAGVVAQSTAVRLAQLARRGPRVWVQRVADEIRSRRRRAGPS